MGAPKNPRKAFRVACVNCHTTQDSLRHACTACAKPLYSNMTAEEMAEVLAKVDQMEAFMAAFEGKAAVAEGDKKKSNPYTPMDKAWEGYRALRGYTYIPGMVPYLDSILLQLLRLKVPLMERTVKANSIFLVVMLAFPLVTLIFGLHWTVSVLLLLPAVMWLFITLKARKDLQRTRDRLHQLESA